MKSSTSPIMRGSRLAEKARKFSSTPGSIKGFSCQATPQEKVFAKRNRSYKYDGYDQWLEKTRTLR